MFKSPYTALFYTLFGLGDNLLHLSGEVHSILQSCEYSIVTEEVPHNIFVHLSHTFNCRQKIQSSQQKPRILFISACTLVSHQAYKKAFPRYCLSLTLLVKAHLLLSRVGYTLMKLIVLLVLITELYNSPIH